MQRGHVGQSCSAFAVFHFGVLEVVHITQLILSQIFIKDTP